MSDNESNKHALPSDEQLVSCEICLKSVPRTDSEVSETEEYVAYFCGLECYDEWKKKKEPE